MEIITRQSQDRGQINELEGKIAKVENAVLKYQEELLKGYVCVDDSTYDVCIELLKKINPYSGVLNKKNIQVYYDLDDTLIETLWEIIEDDAEDIKFMLIPQGMNVKLTYNKGELREAWTYGGTLGETEVTEIIRKVLGSNNILLDQEGEVVLTGTLVLPRVNMKEAKDLCNVQDTYSGVFAVLNAIETVIDDESYQNQHTDLLLFVCTDIEVEGLPKMSIEAKMKYIQQMGLETAVVLNMTRLGSDIEAVDKVVYLYETLQEDVDYKTEGIRIYPTDESDNQIHILKVQKWGRVPIQAYVTDIQWKNTEKVYKPIVCIDREIEDAKGNILDTLELENPLYILFLGLEKDKLITFFHTQELGPIFLESNNIITI